MAKFLLTIKNLDPGNEEDDIVAIAETLPEGLKPEHPIVLPPEPSPPLVIWGGGNEPFPTPPIFLPPQRPDEPPKPPFVIWGPNDPRPTPPIFIPPQPPLGFWGGSSEPFPTPPIYIPPQTPGEPPIPPVIGWDPCDPRPTHPIYIPPQLPQRPQDVVIWGGGNVPFPTPPIVIPAAKKA